MTLHRMFTTTCLTLFVTLAGLLAGCGASNPSSPSDGGACPAEIGALTPAQIHMYSGAQIVALGTNIRCLSDAALGALSANSNAGTGQIAAITVEQINVLSPAQVRMLGATGDGGAVTTSKLANLNGGAWAALAANVQQVAAITAPEIHTLSPDQIKALGTNIKFLSDAALGALSANSNAGTGQIAAITVEQVAVLSPAQIRLLGATGDGGATTTSKLANLNGGAWAALATNVQQVAAITGPEIHTLSPDQIKALGTNIKFLSDAALGALSANSNAGTGQIAAITVEQVAVLSPAQVRLLGATGDGGATTTSKLANLNGGAWAALATSMEQVAAITAPEIHTLSPDQIKALGTNIKFLSDAALGALSPNSNAGTGQIAAITVDQIAVLSPAQVRLLGATGDGGAITTSKLANLNGGAWTALAASMEQVAAITAPEIHTLSPDQIKALGTSIKFLSDAALGALSANSNAGTGQIAAITVDQIAALSPAQIGVIAGTSSDTGIANLNMGAFASLSPAQIAVLTSAQRASLSPAQHTSCGC